MLPQPTASLEPVHDDVLEVVDLQISCQLMQIDVSFDLVLDVGSAIDGEIAQSLPVYPSDQKLNHSRVAFDQVELLAEVVLLLGPLAEATAREQEIFVDGVLFPFGTNDEVYHASIHNATPSHELAIKIQVLVMLPCKIFARSLWRSSSGLNRARRRVFTEHVVRAVTSEDERRRFELVAINL